MKKAYRKLSFILSVLLCVLCMGVSVFASENFESIPDGTVTSEGIYGDVDNIGISPNAGVSTCESIYGNYVNLSSGQTWTSYQYEVSSAYDLIAVGISARTSGTSFRIVLYGSNSVGGTKYEIARTSRSYTGKSNVWDDMSSAIADNDYRYYNVKITNTSSSYGQAYWEMTKN